MRAVKFTFDDGRQFDGFAAGGTWNGFDNVKVTVETAREIDAHFADLIASGDAARIAEMPVDGDGLINLSNGFATQIVRA